MRRTVFNSGICQLQQFGNHFIDPASRFPECRNCFPGIYNKEVKFVRLSLQFILLHAPAFADQPFDPVSVNRPFEIFGTGTGTTFQGRFCAGLHEVKNAEWPRIKPLAFFKKLINPFPAFEPFVCRECVKLCHAELVQ